MNWDTLLLLLVLKIVHADHDLVLNKIINILSKERRNNDGGVILGAPENPENLPEAEPMVPGHALIQPETGMLKSAVKFPHESMANAVYGNMDQLSITYGKTPNRILYTDFRKASSLLDSTILQAIKNIRLYNGDKKNTDVIVIAASAPYYEKPSLDSLQYKPNEGLVSDEENTAREILDESSSIESEEFGHRRKNKIKYKKYKEKELNRTLKYDDTESVSTESTSSSASSDFDKNAGNPFTLHRGKYKQNFMWNHFMDGNHMNINPFGPSFNSPGPSGADLFFGRKWWYFNQDDFKPLG